MLTKWDQRPKDVSWHVQVAPLTELLYVQQGGNSDVSGLVGALLEISLVRG